MNVLNNIVLFVFAITWPLSLYLSNTSVDFVRYVIPAALLVASYFLYKKHLVYYPIPIIVICVFEPKLSLFPIIFTIFDFLFLGRQKIKLLFLTLSFLALMLSFNNFYGQTILVPDYESRQKIIRDANLYPNSFMARAFHNKVKIHTDLFIKNFFVIIDLNNYFFGSAPRQKITSQNLTKFPFLAVIPFLCGFFSILNSKNFKFILASFFAGTFCLSILKLFDRQDFILWLPIFLTISFGLSHLHPKKFHILYLLATLIFSIIEVARIIVFA